MKIALLGLLLASQAFAAAPSPDLRRARAPAYLPEATPAFAETFSWPGRAAPALVARHRVRAGSNALQAFLGPESAVNICDKARAFCDAGSAYWCNYEDLHCDGK